MRLFIGTFVKIKEYDSLQTNLKKLFRGSFVKSENLHLTYLFLGEVNSNQIDNIKSTLSSLPKISIAPKNYHFSYFGTPPKLFVLEFDCKECKKIHLSLKESLKIEATEFRSHITFVRIKGILNKEYDKQIKLLKVPEVLFEPEISLIKSELFSSGPKYQKLFGVPLNRAFV